MKRVYVYDNIVLRMRNIPDKGCRGNKNIYTLFSTTFLLKSCRLWNNVEKLGGIRQGLSDNIFLSGKIAIYMPDN